MTELRFAQELYAGEAVDAACKRFAKFATFVRRQEPGYWVLEVTPRRPAQARSLIGQLQNFALGLTVQRGQP